MKISILVFWGILHTILAFKFEDPLQSGVKWGERTPTLQIVYVDEENDSNRVKFARVTEISGTLSVQVNGVPALKDILDIQIENGNDVTEYYLTGNRVDFEDLREGGLVTSISMGVTDATGLEGQQTLAMIIQNLDDESPTISVSPCTMKEQVWIGVDNSTCLFQVSDRDGWLNSMDFSDISGTKDEDKLFELKYSTPPTDTVYQADVYLVLQADQILDYTIATLYTFHLAAKDKAGHATLPLANIPVIVEVEDIPNQPPK